MSWKSEKDKLGKEIIHDLYQQGMIKTWYRDKPEGWTLVSGIWSPFYIQLRPLSSYPEILKKVGHGLGRLIKEECKEINKIIGVAMAGIPIVTSISVLEGIPSCFTRKLEGVRTLNDFNNFVKKYGEHSMIEGELLDDDFVGFVDDLVTRFDSKMIAIKQLEFEIKLRKLQNVQYSNVIVLFDREQGAEKAAKEYNIQLYTLIPFMSKGLMWLKDIFTQEEYNIIVDYLNNPEKYQNESIQKELFEISNNKNK